MLPPVTDSVLINNNGRLHLSHQYTAPRYSLISALGAAYKADFHFFF